jgi:hypothetical protein
MESCGWIERHKLRRIAFVLILVSYVSAGLFYWRWGGIPGVLQDQVCPLCPNVDSTGSNLQKFTSRTVGMETINAAILIGGLVLFVGIPRICFRLSDRLRK